MAIWRIFGRGRLGCVESGIRENASGQLFENRLETQLKGILTRAVRRGLSGRLVGVVGEVVDGSAGATDGVSSRLVSASSRATSRLTDKHTSWRIREARAPRGAKLLECALRRATGGQSTERGDGVGSRSFRGRRVGHPSRPLVSQTNTPHGGLVPHGGFEDSSRSSRSDSARAGRGQEAGRT